MVRILTEASGSLTSGYLLKAIKDAGHRSIASDIDPECVGRHLADDFILMPPKDDPDLWPQTIKAMVDHQVDIVIPSFDEMLLGWARRKSKIAQYNIHVITSSEQTIQVFQDKWLTYQFFCSAGIPTPRTSLEQEYQLVKPRMGRGARGVRVTSDPVSMDGMISQELVEGEEYTVDVFCDHLSQPVYIIPRKRRGVSLGKSTGGIVVDQPVIRNWVQNICRQIHFIGPINMQCFLLSDGTVKFTEVNPRVAGGMALGFAASENWVTLIVDHLVLGKEIKPKLINYGLKMKRYYAEVFVS